MGYGGGLRCAQGRLLPGAYPAARWFGRVERLVYLGGGGQGLAPASDQATAQKVEMGTRGRARRG